MDTSARDRPRRSSRYIAFRRTADLPKLTNNNEARITYWRWPARVTSLSGLLPASVVLLTIQQGSRRYSSEMYFAIEASQLPWASSIHLASDPSAVFPRSRSPAVFFRGEHICWKIGAPARRIPGIQQLWVPVECCGRAGGLTTRKPKIAVPFLPWRGFRLCKRYYCGLTRRRATAFVIITAPAPGACA